MRYFVSVDRDAIARNKSRLENGNLYQEPIFCVEAEIDGRAVTVATSFEIYIPDGAVRFVYAPENREPGDPHAHAWAETYGPVWYKPEKGPMRQLDALPMRMMEVP